MIDYNATRPARIGSPRLDSMSSYRDDDRNQTDDLTTQQTWCLYLSHFLSMWTSRSYEFAAIVFIQHTFPGDLLPSSINGMTETLSVLIFSAALGRWVDASSTRLRPLLLSIVVNRSAIVLCCVVWLVMFFTTSDTAHHALFVLVLLLGMVEKTSKMTNMLAFEREWIPTVAGYSGSGGITDQPSSNLTHLNTAIRRIDIACKFLAPIAVSGTLTLVHPWLAALFLGIVGSVSCLVEVWSALFVWRSNTLLRSGKVDVSSTISDDSMPASVRARIRSGINYLGVFIYAQVKGLGYYFTTGLWVPSVALSIMHGSVLAWSGTLITWLLNYGFSYNQVTVGKGIGILFEFCSTFAFSWSIAAIVKRESSAPSKGAYQALHTKNEAIELQEISEDDPSDNQLATSAHSYGILFPIINTAKWSIIGLVVCLVPTLMALFSLDSRINKLVNLSMFLRRSETLPPEALDPFHAALSPTIAFLIFLSMSFLGRWTYDLSITQLTQIAIPSGRRSEFGGAEMALTSFFSLGHWIAAAIWHRQEDFKWLATGSVGIVTAATAGYLIWTLDWQRRIMR